MIVGVISDVHANTLALEAALAALARAGADVVYCLGDLVGYGPQPNETVDLLRRSQVLCSLGSSDERVAFGFPGSAAPRSGVADATLEWTRARLTPVNLEFLRSLPLQRRLKTKAGRFRFSHVHPEKNSGRINLAGESQALGDLLTRTGSRILATGGTHVPYSRELPEGVLFNPGSVGLSLNGEPGADYALVWADSDRPGVILGKADYDVGLVAREIGRKGLPQVIARTLEQGHLPDGEFED